VTEKVALGEFTYWIDGRPIMGEVVEKEQARTIYKQEKQTGREAALAEKDDYHTFDIAVSPAV
jgi:Ca-activated chloride channel family protein